MGQSRGLTSWEFYFCDNKLSRAALRGQFLLQQQLLERSAAAVLNTDPAATVSHCEQVISVTQSKYHHMWPARRFWEEGWVTYQRRCHSKALTLNLLMRLPSTSNKRRAALTNHIPKCRRTKSTSCSLQQHTADRNSPLIVWHHSITLIISWTGAVI